VAVPITVLPFASVVVYVYGVGPPGVTGVVPGWPTTTAVVAAAAVAVGDVVGAVVAAVERVWVAWEAEVVVAPPKVCLESMRRKTDGGRRRKEEKNAYKICVTVWPKALVVTCSTMVLPALDGV
jgi:hypothetical protein